MLARGRCSGRRPGPRSLARDIDRTLAWLFLVACVSSFPLRVHLSSLQTTALKMNDDGFQRFVHCVLIFITRAWAHPVSTLLGSNVLAKLLFFAVLVAVVPIATYFITIDRLWDGETLASYPSVLLQLSDSSFHRFRHLGRDFRCLRCERSSRRLRDCCFQRGCGRLENTAKAVEHETAIGFPRVLYPSTIVESTPEQIINVETYRFLAFRLHQ